MKNNEVISAADLCSLTGLTDRRHRQLAKDGYFPQPTKSQYDLFATFAGMLKYYRNLSNSDSKQGIEDEKYKKLKLENDQTEGLLVPRTKLLEEITPTIQKIKDFTYRKLCNEMPTASAGMDVPQNRIYGTRLAGELMEEWAKVFKSWNF